MDINAVIARINELAAKNKTVGLTEEELEEMMDRCSDIIEGVEKRLEGEMPYSA